MDKEITMYKSDDGKLWATAKEMQMRDNELIYDQYAKAWAEQEKSPKSALRHVKAIVRFLMWKKAAGYSQDAD